MSSETLELQKKIWQQVIDECDAQMSHANHRKKVAGMDYHVHEESHQEGRWHCSHDIQKWAEKKLADLVAKEVTTPPDPLAGTPDGLVS